MGFVEDIIVRRQVTQSFGPTRRDSVSLQRFVIRRRLVRDFFQSPCLVSQKKEVVA